MVKPDPCQQGVLEGSTGSQLDDDCANRRFLDTIPDAAKVGSALSQI